VISLAEYRARSIRLPVALERLDRFEEGFRRTAELKRERPSAVLPAMLSGVFAGGLVVAGMGGSAIGRVLARAALGHPAEHSEIEP